MNHLSKRLGSILAPCLGLVALIASPTFAQNRQAQVMAPPVEAQIRPELVNVKKAAPIQFKAFEILDPTNRKPISRDTMLPELPNGKRLTAGQYYDELNKLERQFNGLGQTLKPANEVKPAPLSKFELQTTPVPLPTLQRQAQALRAAHLPNTQFRALDLTQVEQTHKQFMMINPALLNVIATPTSQTVHWVKNWNYSLGDPSVISGYINGKIALDGTNNATSVNAEVDAGGSLFSQSFDLLRVTGNLNAPKTGTMNVTLGASVLGNSVYNVNQNVTTSWSKSDSISKTLDKSVTINFSLGPIPMSAKIGAQGTAGISYGVAVASVKASVYVGPFVHTKAYAQVGVDIVVAGAGAGANLTLLNTDGNLNGAISIEADTLSRPYFKYTDSYSQNLNMLDGNLYVYAYVYVPCWDIPPWCKKEYDWNIFSWTGFKASGVLFNDSKTLSLYAQPVLHP
jgi:hypothetical protein